MHNRAKINTRFYHEFYIFLSDHLGSQPSNFATFSPELSDLTIYVIDVSAGDKIPRKGGPGITKSDLLIINKIDLAPYVGASLDVMDRDTKKMRDGKPFVFSNLKVGEGLSNVIDFIISEGMLSQPHGQFR